MSSMMQADFIRKELITFLQRRSRIIRTSHRKSDRESIVFSKEQICLTRTWILPAYRSEQSLRNRMFTVSRRVNYIFLIFVRQNILDKVQFFDQREEKDPLDRAKSYKRKKTMVSRYRLSHHRETVPMFPQESKILLRHR